MPRTMLPKALRASFQEVKELARGGQLGEARQALAALPGVEKYAEYHAAMGLIAYKEQDESLSLAHMNQALELNQTNPTLALRTAALRYKLDETDMAIELIEKAAKASNARVEDIIKAAHLLHRFGLVEKAIELLKQGILKKPNDAKMRFAYARQLMNVNNKEAAEEQLITVLRLQPVSAQARILLASLNLLKNDYMRAESLLSPVIENPEIKSELRSKAIIISADCLIRKSEFTAASKLLAIIDDAGSARFNYLWGRIHNFYKNYDLAYNSFLVAQSTLNKDKSHTKPASDMPTDQTTLQNECERLKKQLSAQIYRFDEESAEVGVFN